MLAPLAPALFRFVLSGLMSLVVSGIVTLRNTAFATKAPAAREG